MILALSVTNWGIKGFPITPSHAEEESLLVTLNKVEVVRADRAASLVQIGNPEIANVNIATAKTVLVLGISVGETSLLLMDKEGQIIKNINVIVVPKTQDTKVVRKTTPPKKPTHRVTIHQGTSATTSLDCDPTCSETSASGGPGSGTSARTSP
jgi:Flp pilus assembly secretin CpaC